MAVVLFKTAHCEGVLSFEVTHNRAACAKQSTSKHGPHAEIAWLKSAILTKSSGLSALNAEFVAFDMSNAVLSAPA
ncbi:hypothetical protein KM031_05855 [Gemmobacter fulvus]|uniref:Uncharacterized protein n=1 Tax=Gemmobacter fulvus TaxID=2840474 RepID=A0A975P8L6_9RHOB|nr:hypothetical protein [Gemmobacter fulvus]MBT9244543.1 hypothetical protein [Gemmobacter fulvus]QWK91407.1 hypothetical protein KM031_05855 [Gemmobacter fulvus]